MELKVDSIMVIRLCDHMVVWRSICVSNYSCYSVPWTFHLSGLFSRRFWKTVSSSTIGLYRSLSVTPSDGDKSAQRHLSFKWKYVLWIYFRLKISNFQCICYTQPPVHHWATWSTFVTSWLCDWLWDEAFCHCPAAGESNTLCIYPLQPR